jgi:DedD protein
MPSAPVPAADSVDQDEEIIAPAPAAASHARPAAEPPAVKTVNVDKEPARTRSEPEPKPAKPEPKLAEHKPEPKPVEHKPEPKAAERKLAEKSADKPADKPAVKKQEEKPAPKPKDSDAARALALLEGKPVKSAEKHEKAEEKSERFVVQVAALGTQEKVDELQARLRAGGISSFTRKSGALIKVQVGPFASREEADRTKAKLGSLGLGGFLVPI